MSPSPDFLPLGCPPVPFFPQTFLFSLLPYLPFCYFISDHCPWPLTRLHGLSGSLIFPASPWLPPPPEPQIYRSGFPKLIDLPLGLGMLIALPLPECALPGLIQGSLLVLAEMPLLAGSPLALPGRSGGLPAHPLSLLDPWVCCACKSQTVPGGTGRAHSALGDCVW